MKKFSSDYTRIPVIYGDLIQTPVVYPSSRLSQDYTRVAAQGDQPPDLGMTSELIRTTLTKEYGIYPPNLSTSIQQDGSIKIVAVNPQTGLNIEVALRNLAADLILPEGTKVPGVVPLGGQGQQGGTTPASGGAPPATPPGAGVPPGV